MFYKHFALKIPQVYTSQAFWDDSKSSIRKVYKDLINNLHRQLTVLIEDGTIEVSQELRALLDPKDINYRALAKLIAVHSTPLISVLNGDGNWHTGIGDINFAAINDEQNIAKNILAISIICAAFAKKYTFNVPVFVINMRTHLKLPIIPVSLFKLLIIYDRLDQYYGIEGYLAAAKLLGGNMQTAYAAFSAIAKLDHPEEDFNFNERMDWPGQIPLSVTEFEELRNAWNDPKYHGIEGYLAAAKLLGGYMPTAYQALSAIAKLDHPEAEFDFNEWMDWPGWIPLSVSEFERTRDTWNDPKVSWYRGLSGRR